MQYRHEMRLIPSPYPSCIWKPRDAQNAKTSATVHAAIGFQFTPLVRERLFTRRLFGSDVGAFVRAEAPLPRPSSRRIPQALMIRRPGKRLTSADAIGALLSSLVQNLMLGVDHGRINFTHDIARYRVRLFSQRLSHRFIMPPAGRRTTTSSTPRY